MSERDSRRDAQLWEELRMLLPPSPYDNPCGCLEVDKINQLINELELRSIERTEKRQRQAKKYATKHPGKRARW